MWGNFLIGVCHSVDINENDLLDNVTMRNNLLYLGLFKCDILFLVCPIESNK